MPRFRCLAYLSAVLLSAAPSSAVPMRRWGRRRTRPTGRSPTRCSCGATSSTTPDCRTRSGGATTSAGTGWGNEELQFYTEAREQNARVEDGHLFIEACREPWNGRGYANGTHYFTFENERLTDPDAGPPEWPFDQPFHLLLNIAVGGTWGGAQGVDPDVFPQELVVDYVRVYRLEDEIDAEAEE